MSPSPASSAPASTAPGRTDATRFRCPCGRSVAAQRGSAAATSGRCSSCRARHSNDTAESSLRRD